MTGIVLVIDISAQVTVHSDNCAKHIDSMDSIGGIEFIELSLKNEGLRLPFGDYSGYNNLDFL